MFFGDSLGGLFATYVLLNEPTTFRRYGIGSPALDWDDHLIFSREAEYARTHDDLPAKAFFSVGAYENTAGDEHRLAPAPARKARKCGTRNDHDVADTERMVATLRSRAYPSLEIEYELLPREYHETSPPLNVFVLCATSSTRLADLPSRDISARSGMRRVCHSTEGAADLEPAPCDLS